MLIILSYLDQQWVAQLGFHILGDGSSLDISQRSSKDGLSEYLFMYMPIVVSSGKSISILYSREYFGSWAYP
jgi:hypothetical protein